MRRVISPSIESSRLNRRSGQRIGFVPNSPFASAAATPWSPSTLTNLVQRFLDAPATPYHAQSLQSFPILSPEEPGTVAVPRGQRCAMFDGLNDFATLGARLTSGSPSQLTVSAWIKTTDLDGTICGEFALADRGWAFYIANGTGRLTFTTGTGASTSVDYTGPNVNNNAWRHVAVTFNAGSVQLYVDGSAVATTGAGAPSVLRNTASHFQVAAYSSNQLVYSGCLYGVLVDDEAYTAQEIATLYSTNLPPAGKTPLGLWPLQDEWGTTARDVANGRHLTLANIDQLAFHATDAGVNWNYNNWRGYTVANNLLTFSEQFDNAAWGSVGATIAANTQAAPTGAPTADTLTDDSSNGRHTRAPGSVSMTANAAYTYSIYVKAGTKRYVQLAFVNSGGDSSYSAMFDLQTGAVTDTRVMSSANTCTHIASAATNAGNGWYRISLTGSTSATSGFFVLAMSNVPTFAAGTLAFQQMTYAGDSTGTVHLWGAQLELGTAPTNYVQTTSSTLANVIIPASLATPTLDAAGNALGVVGPVAKPATVEVPCVTFDGLSVHATSSDFAELDLTAMTVFCRIKTTSANAHFVSRANVANNDDLWALKTNASGFLQFEIAGSVAVASAIAVNDDQWHDVAVTRASGGGIVVYIDGVSRGTGANAGTLVSDKGLQIGRRYNNTQFLAGAICDIRIYSDVKTAPEILAIKSGFDNRTNIVAHWPCQAGAGTTNTNRTIHDTVGTNHLTLVNGTVANIWANRCPYARDWCIENGGSIAANGSFVPGRIGSNLDAAGNAKTIPAGEQSPYALIYPNRWGAPELVNVGITSSTAWGKTTAVQNVSPADTKYRNTTTGRRNIVISTPAVDPIKTQIQNYVGQP